MACKHCIQIRLGFFSPQFGLLLLLVLQLCGGAKHYYYIHSMPIFIFENEKKNNRKQSRLYSIFFLLGKHAKLILCANKLRVNSFFSAPHSFFSLHSIYFSWSVCVGIYKHLFQ